MRHRVPRRFEVAPDFRMPKLRNLLPAGSRVVLRSDSSERVYYDTASRDLLATGVLLSHSGDDGRWRLAWSDAPAETDGAGRSDIVHLSSAAGSTADPTGSSSTPVPLPAELIEVTLGLRGGAELTHAATIRRRRDEYRIIDRAGAHLLTVSEQHWHSSVPTPAGAELAEWRDLDVQPVTGGRALAGLIAKALTGAGAAAAGEPRSPLARAVDRTTPPPAGSAARRGRSRRRAADSAGAVVQSYLREQQLALLAGDVDLRRGGSAIHPTRVATRRIRSVVRVFGALFDPTAAARLDTELAWFASLLGEVRDRDVQLTRMRNLLAEVPDELALGPVAARIDQQLLSERAEHQRHLDAAMNSDRYFTLLRDVRRWVDAPPCRPAAQKPAATLQRRLDKTVRTMRAALKAGLEHHDDELLHKARKAGKRARYAAEVVAASSRSGGSGTATGTRKRVQKTATHLEKIQDALGAHQDSVVAAAFLRRMAAATADRPDENGFTFGLLHAREEANGRRSRRRARTLFKRHLR